MRNFNIQFLLLGSIGLIFINLGLTIYLHIKTIETKDGVQKTADVIAKSDEIRFHLLEAQNGLRGYALSGNKEYLNEYEESLPQIIPNIYFLGFLVKADSAQNHWVQNILLPSARQKKERMEDTKVSFEKFGPKILNDKYKDESGRKLTKEIIGTLANITTAEKQNLKRSQEEMESLFTTGFYARITSIMFFICVLGLASYLIKRKDNAIQSLLQQMELQNKTLEFRSEQLEFQKGILSETNLKLELSNGQLKKLNVEKNKILAIAAHDLKNPMIGITALAEHLGELVDSNRTEKIELLNLIRESSKKMTALIHQLLNYQTVEKGEIDRKIESVDIHNLTLAHLEIIYPIANNKNIYLNVNSNAEGKQVMTDKGLFIQILDNLISNAIKFSPFGKSIGITLNINESEAILSVEDEGPGIKPEEEKFLFQEFKKLSAKPTASETSTGLGLAIAKRYAGIIQAALFYERPETGTGARFVLRIPNYFKA